MGLDVEARAVSQDGDAQLRLQPLGLPARPQHCVLGVLGAGLREKVFWHTKLRFTGRAAKVIRARAKRNGRTPTPPRHLAIDAIK